MTHLIACGKSPSHTLPPFARGEAQINCSGRRCSVDVERGLTGQIPLRIGATLSGPAMTQSCIGRHVCNGHPKDLRRNNRDVDKTNGIFRAWTSLHTIGHAERILATHPPLFARYLVTPTVAPRVRHALGIR